MTTSRDVDRRRGVPMTAAPLNPILVLALPEECVEIDRALCHSRFTTTRDPGNTDPKLSLSAVLISDGLDNHIALCRAWAEHCPTLLVSARRDFAFRLAAARAGARTIVDRPIDPIAVANSLQFIVGGGTEQLKVLLVDDDILGSHLNAEILRSADVDVVVVNDPGQVLDSVEGLLPDLILMDLDMPGIDGIELAQVIRLTPRLVAIPILFLSVERDATLQDKARRLGGDDFLVKPIDPRKLIAEVSLRGMRAKSLRFTIERDALTGLLDRGRFHERLSSLVALKHTFSLVLLDIDRFKLINDTHGHDVGDRVIQTLAQLLTSELRQKDIVGRCGGEEFGALLLDIDKATACRVINRIRERFAKTVFHGAPAGLHATFSAGIASTLDAIPGPDLFRAADQALYTAKRGGRNQLREAIAA